MSKPDTLTNEQQDDLRGILKTLHKFLKKHNPTIMADSEVLVTKHTASIVISLGAEPDVDNDRATNAYNEQRNQARKVFSNFYTEHAPGGSALMQNTEDAAEGVVARYRLVPNDPIGAERLLKKLIARLEKTYAQNLANCA